MTVLIIALTMALAMMVAAYRTMEIERQAALFRSLKRANRRGHFEGVGQR